METVGVSVFQSNAHYFIRFHLRDEHLSRLGKPDRLTIRGTAPNGFILAPGQGKQALKPTKMSATLRYLQTTITKVDVSARLRRAAWLRPEFERGHLRVPPLPKAWIDAEPEFDAAAVYEEGNRDMKLPRNGRDDALRNGSEVVIYSGSPTAPLPKPQLPTYTIPDNADIRDLQVTLGHKLAEARAIVMALEAKSGLRLTLDRHFRVQVVLEK